MLGYEMVGIQNKDGGWDYIRLWFKDIQALKTSFLFSAINLYRDYSTFNILPHGKGTLHENATIIEILQIMKEEETKYKNYMQEKELNH